MNTYRYYSPVDSANPQGEKRLVKELTHTSDQAAIAAAPPDSSSIERIDTGCVTVIWQAENG